MKTYTLKRTYTPQQTTGVILDENGTEICKTLELPWRENRRGISCIPEGTYEVVSSPPIPPNDPHGRKERPYGHFRLPSVPHRSGILIHRITYVKDLRGCIGVGSRFHDFNNDGIPDMAQSGVKLEWMYRNLPQKFLLKITT